MKLAGKILLTLFLVLLIGALLLPVLGYGLVFVGLTNAVNLNYTDSGQEDCYLYLTRDERKGTLLYRSQGKKAAVDGLIYDPDSGVTEFTIPESYGDYPVVELGGYVGRGAPCPFGVDVQGIDSVANVGLSNGSFDWYVNRHDLKLAYIDLVLNIGPNIREIFADQGGLEAGEELFVVRVYINCDLQNPAFYSENGRLYTKRGELVKGFLYWDEDFIG